MAVLNETKMREFIEFVKTAPVSSGVCCCGCDMSDHPEAMECGHVPTDQWHYSLSLWLEELEKGETDGRVD